MHKKAPTITMGDIIFAEACVCYLPIINTPRQAKIGKFDLVPLIDQDVRTLEISMHIPLFMHVIQNRQQLPKNVFGLYGIESNSHIKYSRQIM